MGTTRKRSAAITLVLAGSMAGGLSGCGDPEAQRDVYANLDDCRKDWNQPADCSRVTDGRHSSSYFYGPRYYGSSFPSGRPRPSANALEASHDGRGGVARMAGSGRSGGTSGSRSVSRSGFGSSGHSMSSGS